MLRHTGDRGRAGFSAHGVGTVLLRRIEPQYPGSAMFALFPLLMAAALPAADSRRRREWSRTRIRQSRWPPSCGYCVHCRFPPPSRLSDGERQWELKFDAKQDPKAGLRVLGFQPGKKHQLLVEIRDAKGKTTKAPSGIGVHDAGASRRWRGFPPVQVKTAKPEQMGRVGRCEHAPAAAAAGHPREDRAGGNARRAVLEKQDRAGGRRRGEPVFGTGHGLISRSTDTPGGVVLPEDRRVSEVHRLKKATLRSSPGQPAGGSGSTGQHEREWCAPGRPQVRVLAASPWMHSRCTIALKKLPTQFSG